MIHTSAARIKAGPQWCGEAEGLSEKFHAATDNTYGDEIPITAAMVDVLGLANSLVVLGSPHPRSKKQTEQILEAYNLELYRSAQQLCFKLKIEFVDLTMVINNPRRGEQRKQLCKTLRHIQRTTSDPATEYLIRALRFLLSEETNSLKAVYAGKHLLSAWRLADSSMDVYAELVDNLKQLIAEHE